MAATELTAYTEHPVSFLGIKFGCNGSNVTQWTVGTRLLTDHHENISQILISGPTPGTTPHTTVLSSLNATSYLNVYEYETSSPLPVGQDQYITLESSQIYYQRCKRMVENNLCRDQTLVAVDVSKFSVYYMIIIYLSIQCCRLSKQLSQLYPWVHWYE